VIQLVSDKKFWEQLVAYTTRTAEKTTPILRYRGNNFTEFSPSNDRGTQTDPRTQASNNSSIVVDIRCNGNVFTVPLPSNDRGTQTDPRTQASNNSSIVVDIRCKGNVFTEPLPSNHRRNTHTDTQTDERDL
jgi:hypothetical protein